MAAESVTAAPTVTTLRKIMKPVISTDIMGNRNVEVKAVGAWAEPAVFYDTQTRMPDAVRAAQLEEEKIRVMQEEKAARLRQFQQDVKKRVRQINKTKRKQQLEQDYQLMEKQHQRLRSSLKASDHLIDHKDRVVSHIASSVAVKPTVTGRLTEDATLEPDSQRKAFEKQNRQVHTYTNQARQKLSGRQAGNHYVEEEFPGQDWMSYESQAQIDRLTGGRPVPEDDDADCVENKEEEKSRNSAKIKSIQYLDDRVKYFSLPRSTGLAEDDSNDMAREDESVDRSDNGDEENEEDEEENQAQFMRVRSNAQSVERPCTGRGSRKVARKKASRASHRPVSAPDLQAGAKEIVEKRRLEQQKLNYRRLYSDLERQAVRDNQRRRTQRSEIRKIKKEKEELRRQEEENARRLVEPRDPITGETSTEVDLRQHLERSHLREVLQGREELRQKQREMTRYLDALRSNLREKMHKQGIQLPSLCCCGETLWDTHPDTCANNCFYYKNHRAYARALQSLLTSSVNI